MIWTTLPTSLSRTKNWASQMTLQVRFRYLDHMVLGNDTVLEIGKLQVELAPWTSPTSRGKSRAISNDHTFSIK